MGKTWLLDTETKGTGAHVVPLEQALEHGASEERDLALVALERPRRAPKPSEPSAPLTFKVVDIMSARVLAEGVSARATVDLLADLRSVLDVRIYVWMQRAGRWRLLTLDEQKALWGFRQHAAVAPHDSAVGGAASQLGRDQAHRQPRSATALSRSWGKAARPSGEGRGAPHGAPLPPVSR